MHALRIGLYILIIRDYMVQLTSTCSAQVYMCVRSLQLVSRGQQTYSKALRPLSCTCSIQHPWCHVLSALLQYNRWRTLDRKSEVRPRRGEEEEEREEGRGRRRGRRKGRGIEWLSNVSLTVPFIISSQICSKYWLTKLSHCQNKTRKKYKHKNPSTEHFLQYSFFFSSFPILFLPLSPPLSLSPSLSLTHFSGNWFQNVTHLH